MREPIEVREIARKLQFIYSKDDCIEIGWGGATPGVMYQDGQVSTEEKTAAIETFLNHPISIF